MAKMFPLLADKQLYNIESRAERILYEAFRDQLSENFEVYHSIGWVLRNKHNQAKDGEADFVICHSEFGFLVVEVKGGGIIFDAREGKWTSIDRKGINHKIKDPVKQALNAKFSILQKLKEHPKWHLTGNNRINIGHAVFFPDIDKRLHINKPDLPCEIVGHASDLESISNWINSVLSYWSNEKPRKLPQNRNWLFLFHDIFARSFEARPLLTRTLKIQEEQRIALTKEQSRILDSLRTRRRVSICGGAGTGKTVLAIEKAIRLAKEGFRTLLTCYNRKLADHISLICHGVENIDVLSFHQLCAQLVSKANKTSGRDLLREAQATYPHANLWDVHYPNALSYTIDILNEPYDAIVCDEGQDFGEEYWVPLELMLSDYEKSPLYIFYDNNQDIYKRTSTFPIIDEPFFLTTNCRNTDKIHNAAYHYYRGEPVNPPKISGQDVKFIVAANIKSQATKLHSKIVKLLSQEKVNPEDIAILIVNEITKSDYYEMLRQLPLPRGVNWLEEGIPNSSELLLDTVKRYKGLEATIIFLWGLDGLNLDKSSEKLYVGMSRAKSLLFLVGKKETVNQIPLDIQ